MKVTEGRHDFTALFKWKWSFPLSAVFIHSRIGKNLSFRVPLLMSAIVIAHVCSLKLFVFQVLGSALTWLRASSQNKNCPARSVLWSPDGYRLWALFHLDHNWSVTILGLYRPRGLLCEKTAHTWCPYPVRVFQLHPRVLGCGCISCHAVNLFTVSTSDICLFSY